MTELTKPKPSQRTQIYQMLRANKGKSFTRIDFKTALKLNSIDNRYLTAMVAYGFASVTETEHGFARQLVKDAGIEDGDILVIDKSLEPQDGDTAVCFIDGEFTLKYIKIEPDAVYLVPANDQFQPLKVTEENNFCIWGVVTYSIKNHKNPRSLKGSKR